MNSLTQTLKEKTPSQKQKIEVYETFLKNLNKAIKTHDTQGLNQLLQNADTWAYVKEKTNGNLKNKEYQEILKKAFWNLNKLK
jgi:hypothetical protein